MKLSYPNEVCIKEFCSARRGQILNQNQATSNLLVAFELLWLLYPPECAGGGARDHVVL